MGLGGKQQRFKQVFKAQFVLVFKAMLKKFDPRTQMINPMMFVVYLASWAATVILFLRLTASDGDAYPQPIWFTAHLCLWLWFTVFFSNLAEAIAEGLGRTHADSLRKMRREIKAKKIPSLAKRESPQEVSASILRGGDLVLVEEGDIIPADGTAVDGIASVDESAITGESAPVIREANSESDFITGGTRILSDWLVIKVTSNPGETFIDKMATMVEGVKRQKTPNEVSLDVLLVGITIIFMCCVASLLPISSFIAASKGEVNPVNLSVLIALFVCLAPTTIGALLSTISISGMNRLLRDNVVVKSGRCIEAAGDVDVLILDKTGTITRGNRQAKAFYPAPGITEQQLVKASLLASLSDGTPEGQSVVKLARELYQLRHITLHDDTELIPFTAETRVSGIRYEDAKILKGAEDAVADILAKEGKQVPPAVSQQVAQIGRLGGTPLVVIDNNTVLGTIYLKDIIKPGIKERLAVLRKMGITSIMITGDNAITAAAIAAEAGVDDYLAQASPEKKLTLIRKKQEEGHLVAMVGDGTNDAPALAQSDVAVVMNNGTRAAKEAGNMIDLDSDPTKLIEIVRVGRQLLMTRGAFTTLSFSTDLAKYFAILPAAFAGLYPSLKMLDVMQLASPLSAILSAVIFNALVIFLMIPKALSGVKFTHLNPAILLRHHLLIYGIIGMIVPFVGIKLINMLLVSLGMV